MDPTSFYRLVDPQLCQGDILERVPHVYLKEQPKPLRSATLPGKIAGYHVDELSPGELPVTPTEGILVPATCQVTRAMLLTQDCEIDKDKRHRLIALIRPIPADMPDSDRTTIRENRKYSFFFLPHGGEPLPESYADFRRICTVSPEWVDSASRLASLTEAARQTMLLQFFRFLGRVELNPDIFRTSG